MRRVRHFLVVAAILASGTICIGEDQSFSPTNPSSDETKWVESYDSYSAFRVQPVSNTLLSEPTNSEIPSAQNGGIVTSESRGSVFSTSDPENWLDNTVAWMGVDSFKAIGDSFGVEGYPNSVGTVMGMNTSLAMGDLRQRFQVGASYGVYDLMGREYLSTASPEQQAYFTAGFSKRSDVTNGDRICWGVVYDQFWGNHWGVLANNLYLGQVRAIAGYALNDRNEVGVWGTYGTNKAQVGISGIDFFSLTAVNQANLYWRHNWAYAASSMVYVGTGRLGGIVSQSQGVIVGMQNQFPLSQHVSAYSNATIAFPGSAPGMVGANNELWNVSAGFQYSFGGKSASNNVSGQQGTPLLPVANNGSFLIRSSGFLGPI